MGSETRDGALIRCGSVTWNVVATMVGGLVFSWIRHRTRTLAGSIPWHVASNLFGIAG